VRAIVTGSSGLVGSEAVRHFSEAGFDVVGIDNDMRRRFFGEDASTYGIGQELVRQYPEFRWHTADICDADQVERIFEDAKPDLVVHCAAQPAHDWAAGDPQTDFAVNANGTLNMLEATRKHCPSAPLVHCSTSKVYGDNPNRIPLKRQGDRYVPSDDRWLDGIDTSMSIDLCTHSLFGVSKTAGDLLVQEYGNYFNMPTVCFRPGCITGPQHAGAELHGFLSYLMKCTMTGARYTVYGYEGLQVRCNISARDLVRAFDAWRTSPSPGDVYNIGGGPHSNCSMLEAIGVCEAITGRRLDWTYHDAPRIGDHKWWVSNNESFELDHGWKPTETTYSLLEHIFEENSERWTPDLPSNE
jgi:CDP-paratose 2-epimerase